jgi:capsular exopolysaccharide synthesis family protein
MSRIFEALQKANLERTVAFDREETFPPKIDIALENITKRSWKPATASLPVLADRGATVEQFRRLRTHLYQLRDVAPLKTILVSSGMPEEGKSFVTANLAISLAQKSVYNILLIDGDLRRPTLHKLLGTPGAPGLSEYLGRTADLLAIIQSNADQNTVGENTPKPGIGNISFIPAGKCGENSSELLSHHRLEELIKKLSPHFDWILIDSPPALVVTDAVDLSGSADAVLLVARGARTPFKVAQRTQAAFSKSRVLGFVLNDAAEVPSGGYSYYGPQKGSDKVQQLRTELNQG